QGGVDGAVLERGGDVGVAEVDGLDVADRQATEFQRLGGEVLPAAAGTAGEGHGAAGELLDGGHRAGVEQVLADHEARGAVLERLEAARGEHPDVDALVPTVPQRRHDGDAADVDLALLEEGDRFRAGRHRVDLDVEAVGVEEAALLGDVQGGEL